MITPRGHWPPKTMLIVIITIKIGVILIKFIKALF